MNFCAINFLQFLQVKLNELKVYYIEDVGNHVMFTKVEKDMVDAVHKVRMILYLSFSIFQCTDYKKEFNINTITFKFL